MKQFDEDPQDFQQPDGRKPTYIKEQNNYNCQQFFGNISGSTFVMPTPQAQRSKSPKQATAKKAAKKPQSAKPMTLKYYRHGNNGMLAKQRSRINILYRKWTEWKWIGPDTMPDGFDAFFEGEPRHCNITWTANATVLTFLLKNLLKLNFIEKQTNCSATSLVRTQFGKTPNSDQKRLDETDKDRICFSCCILDTTVPLPEQSTGNTNEEDCSDAALYEIYVGQLRSTKRI